MNRTKLFINNSFAMALQQVAALAAAFIVPRILITVYGSEINGLVVSLTQFIACFALVEAGISGASVYSLYKPLAEHNQSAIDGIVSAARRFYLQSGWIFVALVGVLAVFYPLALKKVSLPYWEISLIVLALGTAGVMDFFTLSKYRVLLTASQRSYVISVAQIVYLAINTCLVWFLAKLHFNIVALECFLVFSVFARSLILWLYTRKYFPQVNYNAEPDNTSIKDRWNVLYLQLLSGVQVSVPLIIATLFCSLKLVSVYSIYNLIMGGINSVLGMFVSGLAASFGDVIAKKERIILQESYQEFEQFYYMVITVIYSVALGLIIPFIKLYMRGASDVNYILPFLGSLFVFNGLLHNLKTPQGTLVVSAGMYRQTRWQSTAQAAIALIGGCAGAYFFGLYGIIGGLLLSNVYRDIDLLFFTPKNITRLSYLRTVKRIFVVFLNFAAAAVFFLIKPVGGTDTFAAWIKQGIILTSASIICVLICNIIIDRKNMKSIYLRFKNLINRRRK